MNPNVQPVDAEFQVLSGLKKHEFTHFYIYSERAQIHLICFFKQITKSYKYKNSICMPIL